MESGVGKPKGNRAGNRRGLSPGSRATQVQPGHNRPPTARPPGPDAGEPDAVVMRRVLCTAGRDDRTPREKNLRAFYDRHPGQFLATLTQLERQAEEQRAAGARPAGLEPCPPDEAGERLRLLALRLLEADARDHPD